MYQPLLFHKYTNENPKTFLNEKVHSRTPFLSVSKYFTKNIVSITLEIGVLKYEEIKLK
jgi:hypothetical protein